MNIGSSIPQPVIPVANQLASAALPGKQALENAGTVFKPVHETQSTSQLNSATQGKVQRRQQKEKDGDQGLSSEQTKPEQDRLGDKLEDKQEQIEQLEIQELSARDREVRNHERAHAAVGGQYAGAPRYQYERGPDGVNYAVAGEVPISAGPISGDPEATIEKAQVVRRAALAPAEPSIQDRHVAAQATQMEAEARVELSELQREERLQESKLEKQNTDNIKEETVEEKISSANESSSIQGQQKASEQQTQQQQTYNHLLNQLNQSILNSRIDAESPRSGGIVNRLV
jgi:hypothetical protein